MKENLIAKPRITVIDALRGFALLGVILVHMNQHYSYRSMGPFEPHEPILAAWNDTASWLIWSVMLGRFINIFAFLFGMSFFIQMDRAAQKGAILFAMWAYGSTFGAWQAAEVMLLGLGVYLVQVIVCKIWLNYFQYGPLEWLWRSLTYFNLQPFLKK